MDEFTAAQSTMKPTRSNVGYSGRAVASSSSNNSSSNARLVQKDCWSSVCVLAVDTAS